jgi:Flp pilus assembly protein TadB
MKKLIACIAAALLLVTFTPTQLHAEKKPGSTSVAGDTGEESAELKAIINRVNEINAMDRSDMTRLERKEIRKELRDLKREANRHSSSGAIYISGGLLVLILVLIIIF